VKYILIGILLYILYQFIFKLVVPVYSTAKNFKKGVRDMQDKINEQFRQQQQHTEQQDMKKPGEPKKQAGEYIDFEEVK